MVYLSYDHKKNATIYLEFCITKIWQILVSTFLFHLIWKNYVLCLEKSQIVDLFTHFNHWKKCHKQFFISSKYHRRKIIISTFLKCFTLHWLEYLVHFFTLSTNDDIKTPIFIARIYCIGSFFKPKKILFYIPWSFPKWTLFTMQRQRFQKWFAE